MNKSESKYFNTAVKMDKAMIEILEKKISNILPSKKYAIKRELTDQPSTYIIATLTTCL